MAAIASSPRISIGSKDCLELDSTNTEDATTHVLIGDLVKPFSLGPLTASLISLPPGTRTIARAHSRSSVFVYVTAGSGICWHHGSPYDMAQNDCVGFRGGSGLAFAFVNDGHNAEPLDIVVFSERHDGDEIAYFGQNGDLTSTWKDPPPQPLGTHDGLPLSTSDSSLLSKASISAGNNPTIEAFWPSSIFHSLVMSIPNLLPAPETAEVAPLSILASLTSSANCRFTVTQTVVQPRCRAPAYGPRAHSIENRLIFVCAASLDGGAKLWLDGEASELVTGSCVRLQAGTGFAWCILNEGDEELIFLEFAQDVDEDSIIFPLASAANGGTEATEEEARQRCIDELGRTWWEDAPLHKLGAYPAIPQEHTPLQNQA